MIEAMNIPKLRFPEFQDIWASDNLISLSKVKMSNGVFNDPKKVGSGYRLINVKDMYIDRKIDIDTLTFLELDKTEFERNKAAWGDVFFTRSSLVKEGIAFSNIYVDTFEDVTYDGHLVRMRPNQDIVGTFFLSYLLKTSLSRKQLILRGKTTTMTTIGQEDISTVVVSYPTKPEQTKIAAFLTSVDTKIEQLAKKQELLSEYKKGLMEKIFSQAIRFKADDGSNFPDWEEKRLGDIGEFKTSSVDKKIVEGQKLIRLVNYMNVFKHENIDSSAIKNLMTVSANETQLNSSNLKRGDILFTPSSETPDDIGHSVVIFEDLVDTLYSYHLIRFRPKAKLDILYSHYFCNISDVLRQISRVATGSTRFTVSLSEFSKIQVNLPSLPEQTKIANFLSPIDSKIEQIAKQLYETKQFKKALLQQMFV